MWIVLRSVACFPHRGLRTMFSRLSRRRRNRGVFTEDAAPALREQLSTIVRDYHPAGFRLMAASSAEVDTRDLLPRLALSTLLLWGDADRRSPTVVAEQFRTAIPNAELMIIPNAGHLSNMEQPNLFNTHVRRFCLSA